jgi:hypothetical protein
VYIIANWEILVKYYSSTHFSGLERFTAILCEDLVSAPAVAKAWILADQNPI